MAKQAWGADGLTPEWVVKPSAFLWPDHSFNELTPDPIEVRKSQFQKTMEGVSDHLPLNPPEPSPAQLRFDQANDFLTICDRVSTGYDSGYYWEDVQRALRIAAGLEKWPD